MGLGVSEDVFKGVEYLLGNYTGKLILDADGLNALAKYGSAELLLKKKCEVLITPHVKEFSRLTSKAVEDVLSDSLACAKDFADAYQVAVLLKGASTVITDGKQTFLNLSGCSAQAKGGSGDVLAGLIGGLCAQGLSVFDGGIVGSYIVGVSAELSSEDVTEYSALPTDFIQSFTRAFKAVTD
jgi:NAD(P)H-hydrate epimerase